MGAAVGRAVGGVDGAPVGAREGAEVGTGIGAWVGSGMTGARVGCGNIVGAGLGDSVARIRRHWEYQGLTNTQVRPSAHTVLPG